MMGFVARIFRRSEPVLSQAGARDAAAIAALHAASFHRGWSEQEVDGLLIDPSVLTLRAMAGRTLAGFIMARMVVDEAEILSVAVARAWQGRGLARQLLTLSMRRLAGLGARTIFLEVSEDNEAALALYKRAGFHQVSHRENYYSRPSGPAKTALILRRDLV